MDRDQIEEIFYESGSQVLNSGLAYKVWLKGEWDTDNREDIEDFLSAYSFVGERELYADELLYHYRIFKYISEKNELSFFSW
ncbi:hypothetical protein J7I93_05280 [Bacillus sp. ISL-47]|uniref:hypothetical protein n=1 Tax=Bacillus sp. ISL-47 TaxID=2819130 RepID=UPI001BEBB39D|nr:hypothetical protein [Bacillus sp. ISL-47]MBT2687593.1 hypothetical protein [Bacillus sp. ISL-47]MBT2706410.1 hypothetical protein [Pseudomonas sp. ISL-84]